VTDLPTVSAPLDACTEHGIALEAYSPLGTGSHLDAGPVAEIARRLGRTPAQILVR
jgi:diketogulonate reductase-like aldo/keto reductase